MFRNVHELSASGLKLGCETGKFPEPMPEMPETKVKSLAICTDEEQSQITGGEYIFGVKPALECTGVRLSDPFHRLNNDVNISYAKSGLQPIVKAATLFLDIGYGPWQSCAWFHMIVSEGQRITKFVPATSKLLRALWPRILLDKGIHYCSASHVTDNAARIEYLQTLPDLGLMNLRGIKVSPASWMSIQKAGHAWDDTLSSRAFVLASLCIKKGWIVTSEDLFAGTRMGANSCVDKPAPKSKAAAVRDAQSKLAYLKERQRNNLCSATKLLCDVDVVNGFRILLLGGKSQWIAHTQLVDQLTSAVKCLAHCLAWAKWGWLASLHECNRCLSDAGGMRRCGIESDFTTSDLEGLTEESAQVKYQDALAMRLQRLQFTIVSTRAGSLMEWVHYYPYRLALLTSEDPSDVKFGLIEFERDVRAWWASKDSNKE